MIWKLFSHKCEGESGEKMKKDDDNVSERDKKKCVRKKHFPKH